MIITEELAKELNLTPEQVSAINPKITDYVSDQKKEWDGKANEQAEGILSGAAKYFQDKTGVKEDRQQGEKFADYFQRVSDRALEGQKSKLEEAQAEYAKKLKDFKGDEATKAELDKAKSDLDEAKKQLADYDVVKEKAGKYDETSKSLSDYKRMAAFGNVKPSFTSGANKYEVDAKWKDFQKRVEDKYNIELVDGEYMAVDKENQYKNCKLSDLVEKDEELKSITEERKQGGTGATGEKFKVEGFDGEISKDVKTNTVERSKLIKEKLAKDGISVTDPSYAAKFSEYNKKIIETK